MLSALLIHFRSKNYVSYASSYSNIMLTSLIIFTLSMTYVPVYVASIKPPYYFMIGFILQIVNILLYDELIQSQHNSNNVIFSSVIFLQLIVFAFIFYQYYFIKKILYNKMLNFLNSYGHSRRCLSENK